MKKRESKAQLKTKEKEEELDAKAKLEQKSLFQYYIANKTDALAEQAAQDNDTKEFSETAQLPLNEDQQSIQLRQLKSHTISEAEFSEQQRLSAGSTAASTAKASSKSSPTKAELEQQIDELELELEVEELKQQVEGPDYGIIPDDPTPVLLGAAPEQPSEESKADAPPTSYQPTLQQMMQQKMQQSVLDIKDKIKL